MTAPTTPTTTLDDLLFNRKEEPYTLRGLFEYLESKHAPELLDFWLAAQDVRNMYEPKHERSSFSMNRNHWKMEDLASSLGGGGDVAAAASSARKRRTESLEEVRQKTPSVIRGKLDNILVMVQELKRKHAEAQILVKMTYVDDEAPLCINVSNEMREQICANCPASEDQDPRLGLFDDAMEECEKLMTENHLWGFLAACRASAAAAAPDFPKPPLLVATPPPPRT